jgi:hypothetical protein
MKYMSAFSPNFTVNHKKKGISINSSIKSEKRTQWTVIARHFTRWTTALVRYATNTTDITLTIVILLRVASIPAPLRNGVPSFNDYFHGSTKWEGGWGGKGSDL